MSGSVFISYAREDAAQAQQLAAGLERAGFTVWLDRERMRAGSFSDQLDRAIARCDVFLLLLSPSSARSTYVNRELHVAADDHDRPILPVVIEEADVTPFRLLITGLQRVDFTTRTDAELADVVDGVYRTAAAWRRHRPSPGDRAARVVGAAVSGLGTVVAVGGMGLFFFLFAQAWNSDVGSEPSPLFPAAFGIMLVGIVVAGLGEAVRRAAVRRTGARR